MNGIMKSVYGLLVVDNIMLCLVLEREAHWQAVLLMSCGLSEATTVRRLSFLVLSPPHRPDRWIATRPDQRSAPASPLLHIFFSEASISFAEGTYDCLTKGQCYMVPANNAFPFAGHQRL